MSSLFPLQAFEAHSAVAARKMLMRAGVAFLPPAFLAAGGGRLAAALSVRGLRMGSRRGGRRLYGLDAGLGCLKDRVPCLSDNRVVRRHKVVNPHRPVEVYQGCQGSAHGFQSTPEKQAIKGKRRRGSALRSLRHT